MNRSIQNTQPIQIFIGSSDRNVVEEKVFIYSLLKTASLPIEINTIDGKTGAAKMQNGEVKPLPDRIRDCLKGATAFSLGRFAIPAWCNYQGRAIYCDSDEIALTDIAELWNFEMDGANVASVHVKEAKSNKAYVSQFLNGLIQSEKDYYLTSVMLMDCAKLQSWNLETIVAQLNQDQFSYTEMMFLEEAFTRAIATEVKALPNCWNHLDVRLPGSKIVHFTDLTSQPWLFHHNPVGAFWEAFFLAAFEQNFLNQQDLQEAYDRGVISQRIRELPTMQSWRGQLINECWRRWSAVQFRIGKFVKLQFDRVRFALHRLSQTTEQA